MVCESTRFTPLKFRLVQLASGPGRAMGIPYVDLHSMPANIQKAVPSGVTPYVLHMAFVESREYVQLQAQYHDGSAELLQLPRTWRKTSKRET